eukprot:snap_masked-scaffold261_size233860-processed-gene-1.12 protein:Tk10686 transcript:snap_masked-scaffold261_size233860-processed-gene-1.12-mRNA-1 annotation:"lag1 longevity assurance homolog 6-like"
MLPAVVRVVHGWSQWFWSESFWLPTGTSWEDIQDNPDYAQFHDLLIPVIGSVGILLGRWAVYKYALTPIGLGLGLPEKPPPPPGHRLLEAVYRTTKKRNHPHVSDGSLAKTTGLSEEDIQAWFHKRTAWDKPSRLDKFCESAWKTSFYVTIYAAGWWVLWNKPWFEDILHCWYNHPHHKVSLDVWMYYMVEMSYYWSLLVSQFFDVQRADFWEMFVHHIATILLLSLSWTCNFVRVGTLVLWVHDCSDVFLESAKMFRYVRMERLAHLCFYVFALSWMVTRLGLFPTWILYSVAIECVQLMPGFGAYRLFSGLLSCLLVLHLFWSYYIFKVAYLAFLTPDGVIEKDARSDSESGDEE